MNEYNNQTAAEMEAEARAMRAREVFVYYDTIKISPSAGTMPGWFTSFAALAGARELPLLNIRSRATVESCYCNLDTPGQLDVGFLIKSVGIEFMAPIIGGYEYDVQQAAIYNLPGPYSMWMDCLEHSLCRFYVNQDEKFCENCALLPPGYGASGDINAVQGGQLTPKNAGVAAGALTNGLPDLDNRQPFAKPIEVPRNTTIRAVVELSDFARDNLSRLDGPGYLQTRAGAISQGWVPAVCGIRITVAGIRLTQLRNAQSY